MEKLNRRQFLKAMGLILVLNPMSEGGCGYLRRGFLKTNSENLDLKSNEYEVLDEMFRCHLNYFLSPEIITDFGFPMTAYKVGNRARFGYSNPTEWGYAWQAWIAAAERRVITKSTLVNKLKKSLSTLDKLQQTTDESYQGFPYPFYKMTDPDGKDLPTPRRDPNPNIPSGDNALLYASLLIVEGWSRRAGELDLGKTAKKVRERMDFRPFLKRRGSDLFFAHTLNADSGDPSSSVWDIFADEGGVVSWIGYISGSIDFEEYKEITNSQHRRSANWISCTEKKYTVEEAAWFNMMFTWSVRSLAGFPIGTFDTPSSYSSTYSRRSLVPTTKAHLAYGDCEGVDHPAFSAAMSQAENGRGLVGWIQNWFIPPNLPGQIGATPNHAVPHALFVPFNALPDLASELRARLVAEIAELKKDKAQYYHDSKPHPYGFEVIASPYKDDLSYSGADDGRKNFETLSEAYTTLSLFNALQLNSGEPTFCHLATEVPGYLEKLRKVLGFLYP